MNRTMVASDGTCASKLHGAMLIAGLLLALAACTPLAAAPSNGKDMAAVQRPARTKTIVFGVNVLTPLARTSVTSAAGGWMTAIEIHTNGLITSDVSTRKPVGRLAEAVPSLDDGTISLLPDGRMRVIYHLRHDVTWQDGVPFTAQDLVFSQHLWNDPGLPADGTRTALNFIQSSEAPDDYTFVLSFKQAYYLAGVLSPRLFWPVAQHIVKPAYDAYLQSGDPTEIENLPYWTGEYVGTGPFRVTSFDMGREVVLHAYDGYFLGRPRVDEVVVRLFPDQQTLLTNILAGAVDIFPENTLTGDPVFELQRRWDDTGAGQSYIKPASTRYLAPQWRPDFQMEPANLDVNVRAALYQAIDRDTLAETLQGGYKEMAAWEILPSNDPLYPAVQGGMRRYPYDPARAQALLAEAGWQPGSDGTLRHAVDGRPFRTAIQGLPGLGASELLAVGGYWKQLGIEVEIVPTTPAQAGNLEFAASYSGWTLAAGGVGDGILARLDGPAAGPQTRWLGNSGGYEDPAAKLLLDRYRGSLSERDQVDSMRAINDFVVAQLPFLPLYAATHSVGRRTGVIALDDQEGGDNSSRPYGTYTRNAHLWDLE